MAFLFYFSSIIKDYAIFPIVCRRSPGGSNHCGCHSGIPGVSAGKKTQSFFLVVGCRKHAHVTSVFICHTCVPNTSVVRRCYLLIFKRRGGEKFHLHGAARDGGRATRRDLISWKVNYDPGNSIVPVRCIASSRFRT